MHTRLQASYNKTMDHQRISRKRLNQLSIFLSCNWIAKHQQELIMNMQTLNQKSISNTTYASWITQLSCRSTAVLCKESTCSTKSIPHAVRLKLAWSGLFMPIFWQVVFTVKYVRLIYFFGMRSGFITSSVHARLQASVCSGYNWGHPG